MGNDKASTGQQHKIGLINSLIIIANISEMNREKFALTANATFVF